MFWNAITLQCTVMLQSIDEWSFDVFAINAASEGNALKFVGYELLQKYDLISKFKVRTTARMPLALSRSQICPYERSFRYVT